MAQRGNGMNCRGILLAAGLTAALAAWGWQVKTDRELLEANRMELPFCFAGRK